MNPFVNVFTDTVDFDQVEWDEFTSFIATTDDIKLLLFRCSTKQRRTTKTTNH
jgi:hypothetical protein